MISEFINKFSFTAQRHITNRNEIMVGALQRSGHHAFIVWILKNVPQHAFANCVADHRIIRPNYIKVAPELRFTNDLELDVEEEFRKNWKKKNLFIYNTEHKSTSDALAIFDHKEIPKRIGRSGERRFIVWLRDPFNNMASLYKNTVKHLHTDGREQALSKLYESRALWIDHCRVYLHGVPGRNDLSSVLYNKWLDDMSFRETLLQRLGYTNLNDVTDNVRWGSGSSFRSYSENQKASDKQELESRYRYFEEDEDFLKLFRHDEFLKEINNFLSHYTSGELQRAHTLIKARV